MKKRLLCILLAVSMIGSSMTVFAAEQGDQLATQTPASEEFAGEGEEGQEEETVNPDASAEPAVTPETVPGEEPDGIPEETVVPDETPAQEPEATPTGEPEVTPTQEPDVTPGTEPAELPDESPSPEASATPSMTPLIDEGIMSIAEDEELVGANDEFVGLVVEEGATIEIINNERSPEDNIWVKKNASLTINGSSTFTGIIKLEEGATLTINGYAIFPLLTDGKDAFSNVSGEGTVLVKDSYSGQVSDNLEEMKYKIVTITVNPGITLKTNKLTAYEIKINPDGTRDQEEISNNLAWHLQGGGKVIFEEAESDGSAQRWTVTDNTTLEMSNSGGNVIFSGKDLIVDVGANVKVKGNFTHSKGPLILNGGTVEIAGDYTLGKDEFLEMNHVASTLKITGDFVKNSQQNNHCTAGTMHVGGDIYLEVSTGESDGSEKPVSLPVFSGGSSFRLILDGNGAHRIWSNNWLNVLNIDLANDPKIDIEGPVRITAASDGFITPVGGTLALTGSLELKGHDVKIKGNVETSSRVDLGAGGRLEVTGNYMQRSDSLKIGDSETGSGEVVIGGDFRMQGYGGLIMENPLDKLTVNGNVYMESVNVSANNFFGTMTVKGNIDQKNVGEKSNFRGNKGFTLVLAGDVPQTVSLESSNSILNNLDIRNQNGVTVKGYLNANLVSDGSISLPADGTLEITKLDLQNHKLEIKGDADSVVKASGSVILGGLDGYLIVPGDYMQSSGTLRIGAGQMEVGGDLLLHDKDENGNRITGDGYLAMVEEEGRLTVKGDMIVQSTRDTNLNKGTIILSGDLIQKKGEDGSGTGDIEASASHKVILAGDGPQNVQLESEGSKLGTLQLTKDPSNYEFDPSDVSIKVTTGETPTPKPTTGPTSKPTSEPPSEPSPTAGPAETPAPIPQPTPTSGPYDWPFSDVSVEEGSWRYESVKYVYEKGVMNGISGTTRFAPNEPLTRGMFATVLYRMAGEPEVAFKDRFQDVQEGRYYDKAIIWANDRGIVDGLDGGTRFAPEEFITREQIAKMLYEYGRYQGYAMDESADLGGFPDNSDVSNWAIDYMKWAVGSGMINGKNIDNAHYLDPRGNASRVECAAMLTRFMTRYM